LGKKDREKNIYKLAKTREMKRKYLKDQRMFVKEENIKERWKSFLLEAILDIEMN
jgi:hypothetical protein